METQPKYFQKSIKTSPAVSSTPIRINANTTKTLEVASFLYAFIELLSEKGLLAIEELDERKKRVAERLVRKLVESGSGLMYQDAIMEKSLVCETHSTIPLK